ncbi:ABC-2 type transport system permease protein [Anaerocolumna xylanovorans DSM 12503]|uniref:ABC-2 type transport system permease protein n=2 Tax=Anaerocolumna TaxID=1843210 RepID=A0A1M7YFF0_9FIRM|nr:ABC-2 type transport system permease protein [Anaerocolumna xylanovorans DSM 12503]
MGCEMRKSTKYYTKIYLMLISKYVKARMAYRADFLISLIGIFIENTIGLLFYSVVFMRVTYIGGWGYNELLFIYGFLVTASSVFHVFFGNMFNLKTYIVNGDFTKFYFRPMNILFSFVSEYIDIKSIFQVIIGIYLMVISSNTLNIIWDFQMVLLLILLIISSGIIIISTMTICASLGFWVRDPSVIMDFMLKVKDYSKYPMTIYNKILQLFFSIIIPLGFMSYYPSLLFLKNSVVRYMWIVPFQLIVSAVYFFIAVFVFQKGTRFYEGAGS